MREDTNFVQTFADVEVILHKFTLKTCGFLYVLAVQLVCPHMQLKTNPVIQSGSECEDELWSHSAVAPGEFHSHLVPFTLPHAMAQ